MLTTIRSGPRRRIAEPAVWLSSTHPCAAQLATAASRRRCRSTAEIPRRVRRATMRPITAAARIPTTTQTQVGVVLDELVLEVVPVVGTTTLRVVVCSTVETKVDAA